MIFIGIDPGVTGAMAIIYEEEGDYDVFDFDRDTTLIVLNELLDNAEDAVAVVEKQWMRKGDSTHMGKLIQNFGEWVGRLDINFFEHREVAARTWKNAMGVTSNKKAAMELAKSLFPEVEHKLQRAKDHNRAEALLIANYCAKLYNEGGFDG
jgi:hypothetical protein